MLEEYDQVIVFPYPKKYHNGIEEKLPPIKQRMKMLEIFCDEFFPQVVERLVITNLSEKLKLKDKKNEGVLHTYDYINYVKQKAIHYSFILKHL